MKQKKHLSLTTKLLITLGILVLSFILFRATQILLDYQNFRRNEKAIAALTIELSKETKPSEQQEGKYCQEVHLKFQEGPKSCYVYRSLYYSLADLTSMQMLAEKNNSIINKNDSIMLTASGDETARFNNESKQYYSFKHNHQDCDVSHYFYTDQSSRELGSSDSRQGKKFRGLVTVISCGQGVKWAYYPLQ